MARATISDVAREAGVSLGTVSHALNHPDKVRSGTLERINEAIERLGYVPNQGARQLAGGQSKTFGLILPRLDHAFSLQIANGAQDEARKCGYSLLIASAGNDDILENHYMRYFLGAQMEGVLVQPMAGESWAPPHASASVPTVYLDVHSEAPGYFVAADNEGQGRLVLEHAAACGAKKVAVIGEAPFGQLALRVFGILGAAAECGVDVELVSRGDWNSASDGFALGRELASRAGGLRPDFVIGLTDVLAAGAIGGIQSAGREVPKDILVAGCDGNPLAWGGSVPLTTITSPGEEIGRRGVRLLLSLASGKAIGKSRCVLVPSALVPRASSAASRTAQELADAPGLNLAEYI